ncbi:MAG: FKBP-type peptidyl-prolyl cis-trans isomerase [Lachnospiraceae bacterium]|nr:FKBP-type peptidyl-prolyl cis-trans isomerase [Lachnospiraceae bacterium]
MAKNKTTQANAGTEVSKSKAKREERRKQVQKAKREARAARMIGTAVALIVGAAIVFVVGKQLYIMAIRTTPGTEYSAGLTADGKIENADMAKALTLADYKNISVPEDEVAATQEEVENEIESMLESYKELSTDADLVIADGDEVNIDYVGTVDGVEFDGGNSGGAGYDVVIGSGSLVDDFEQQLIGHKPGDELTVEVTFPEDYSEEMAGKDASFAVTVNGIQKTPELTDEFVAENLADTEEVSTVAEYRAKVEEDFHKDHLQDYLSDYVVENSTVNTYPSKYLKATKSILKYGDTNMGMENEDEIAYEKELTERAKEQVKEAMVYQAIFEDAGLSFDIDAFFAEQTTEESKEYAESIKEMYGEGFVAQSEKRKMAIEHLVGLYQ